MQPEYERGDIVRLRVTPAIAGQIIGEEDWGARYAVRLSGSVEVEWFENVEIEPVWVEEPQTNVVDFTRAKKLHANTKTEGEA